MILPSGWRAMTAALSTLPTFDAVVLPPEPNDASSFPLGSRRARPVLPPSRMSPLGSGIAPSTFPRPGTELPASDVHPPAPKAVSILPGAVAAAALDALAAAAPALASRLASRMPGTRYQVRRRLPVGMLRDLGIGDLPSWLDG